ncbi:heterokaryon incompatibility protein-domain-containing protein [Leptodontidium sp. 2 PMI_412]|nr:heterokaryon incompatibility protein-domain-containing protein [Leptodontidium sp. 2 PMI_412]
MGVFGFAATPYVRRLIEGPGYEYQSLKKVDDIRILVLEAGQEDEPLRCHVKDVSLSSNTPYEALSYVWGDPTVKVPIECSGRKLNITTNLFDALKRFRLPDADRVLWVDAICINQFDLEEKNIQVPLMKDIYSKASVVLIWLGRGSEETDRAWGALAQMNTYFHKHLTHYTADSMRYFTLQTALEKGLATRMTILGRKQTEEIRQLDWNAIASLLRLPWFTRAWTMQEYVKAPRAVVVCGAKSTTFNHFSMPLIEIYCQYIATARTGELGVGVTFPIEAIWSIREMSLLRAKAATRRQKKPLLDLVKQNNVRAATNPRDKIYGFLGMATDLEAGDWPLYPKYNLPVEEVYKQFAWWCIEKSGNLDILSSIRDYRVHSTLGSVPSWTPDWIDQGGKRDTELSPVTTYAGGKGHKAQVSISPEDDNVLLVKGFVVDRLDRLAISYYQYTLWDDYRHLRYPEMVQSGEGGSTRAAMVARFLSENVAIHYLDGLVAALQAVQKYSSNKSSSAVLRDIVWVEDCKNIASGGTGQMSEERYEIFWRTIASNRSTKVDANRVVIQDPAPGSFKWEFKKHFKLLDDLREGRRTLNYGMAPYQTGMVDFNALHVQQRPGTFLHQDEYDRWRHVSQVWVEKRRMRFCSTTSGNLGWAPNPAQEGDLMCIFYGAKTPHVLRPCGDGKFKLIGVGYLHGMMHGEVLKMKQFQEQEFAIC